MHGTPRVLVFVNPPCIVGMDRKIEKEEFITCVGWKIRLGGRKYTGVMKDDGEN